MISTFSLLTGPHEWLQPAKVARHLLEDVAFGAISLWGLAHYPGEEEYIPVQGEQGAARAHGAVGIGPRSSAAHFIGYHVGVRLQTLREAPVRQGIKVEWALESRNLFGFFPASDHGRELSCHQDTLSKISFWQTSSNHISLKDNLVTELDHSQVIFRTTHLIARVGMN